MKLTVAARMAKARAARVYIVEDQTPWCGLAYVDKHGMPGYPPPRTADHTDLSESRTMGDRDAFDMGCIA